MGTGPGADSVQVLPETKEGIPQSESKAGQLIKKGKLMRYNLNFCNKNAKSLKREKWLMIRTGGTGAHPGYFSAQEAHCA